MLQVTVFNENFKQAMQDYIMHSKLSAKDAINKTQRDTMLLSSKFTPKAELAEISNLYQSDKYGANWWYKKMSKILKKGYKYTTNKKDKPGGSWIKVEQQIEYKGGGLNAWNEGISQLSKKMMGKRKSGIGLLKSAFVKAARLAKGNPEDSVNSQGKRYAKAKVSLATEATLESISQAMVEEKNGIKASGAERIMDLARTYGLEHKLEDMQKYILRKQQEKAGMISGR